nr:MAG TPA: HTH-type transcriptional regulator [Caudoviricetes sp.]
MTDHNSLPLCPYCGDEMKKRVLSDYKTLCFWLCPKCSATSPSANTAEDAYAAAMNRWQEPNRVLTLEEVQEHCKQGVDAAPLWVEFSGFPSESHWMAVDLPDEVFCTDTVRNFCMSYVNTYKKSWRCWFRKPTQKEMTTVPWREK